MSCSLAALLAPCCCIDGIKALQGALRSWSVVARCQELSEMQCLLEGLFKGDVTGLLSSKTFCATAVSTSID